jgi:hypothetical protein
MYGKSPLDALREFLLRYWWVLVRRCLAKYLKGTYGQWRDTPSPNPELSKDLQVGWDCISKTTLADWWEWRGGSLLFFWRWPMEARLIARDGHPIWIQDKLPTYRSPQ